MNLYLPVVTLAAISQSLKPHITKKVPEIKFVSPIKVNIRATVSSRLILHTEQNFLLSEYVLSYFKVSMEELVIIIFVKQGSIAIIKLIIKLLWEDLIKRQYNRRFQIKLKISFNLINIPLQP